MATFHNALIVIAFVLFVLAAFNVTWPRVNFGWLALAVLTFDAIVFSAQRGGLFR